MYFTVISFSFPFSLLVNWLIGSLVCWFAGLSPTNFSTFQPFLLHPQGEDAPLRWGRRNPSLGEVKPFVGADPHPRKGSQPTPQGHRRHASRATQKSVQGRCPTPAGEMPNPSREERPSRQVAEDLLSRWLYLPFVCFDDAVMEISRQNGKCLLSQRRPLEQRASCQLSIASRRLHLMLQSAISDVAQYNSR